MSEAALHALQTAEQALRGAIESGHPESITEATTAFVAALDTVRGIDAWHVTDELKNRLNDLKLRLDADQKLVRLLSDMTRQQLEGMAGATPAATARATYGRRG